MPTEHVLLDMYRTASSRTGRTKSLTPEDSQSFDRTNELVEKDVVELSHPRQFRAQMDPSITLFTAETRDEST